MKFLHMADLHIGKVLNDFPMLEEQKYILDEIVQIACRKEVDAIVMAGDIYDRSIPPAEAVAVFDAFITRMVNAGIQVILVAGNHDSQERVSFLENILCRQGVHIAGVVKDKLTSFTLEKEEVTTEFVLLPFCKPSQVECQTSQEAVQKLLSGYWKGVEELQSENGSCRERKRVLVTHFFVTNGGWLPELSESETTIHVGNLDNVDVSVLEGFDYVALGHIHKPQRIGGSCAYYAGTPLKYSFGETNQEKGVFLVEIGVDEINVEKVVLTPLHDMRKIEGTLQELLDKGREEGCASEDYIQACLTDEGELLEPMETLRSVYPNVMQIVRKRNTDGLHLPSREKQAGIMLDKRKEPLALFEDFYQEVSGTEINDAQKDYMQKLIRELEE